MESRHRSWALTLWEYPSSEVIETCKYLLMGEEICPSTGRMHWQSYCVFKNPKYFNGVKKLFGKDASIRACRGTFEENWIYCTKDKKWEEFGTRPCGMGTRNDLTHLKKNVFEERLTLGDIVRENVENYQQLKFVEGLMKYVKPYEGPRNVIYIWGKTGVGKSKLVRERESAGQLSNVTFVNNFFIGYDGSKSAVFDDFRGEMPFRELLKITDRYAVKVNVKGGELPWNAVTIYFTSDRPPQDLYVGVGDVSQFIRRIKEIIHLKPDLAHGTEVQGNTKPEPVPE